MKQKEEDYKVFKIKLQDIILNNDIKNKITDACRRTHLITTHVYQFIRLYILNSYHNNLQIPFIDKIEEIILNKNINHLINNELLNIPNCKNSKIFTIIDYQNSFIFLYEYLYLNDINITKNEIIKILKDNISIIIDNKNKNKIIF